MSLEVDITEIRRGIQMTPIEEGFAEAKRKYVEQGIMTLQPDGTQKAEKIPVQILTRLATKYDPTYPDRGKYIEWIAKQYMQNKSSRGLDAVAEFEQFINTAAAQVTRKDINQYKTLEDLTHELDAARSRIAVVREQKREAEVRKILVKSNGSVERAMKLASGGEAGAAGNLGQGSLVRDFGVTEAYITKIKKKMEKEEAGIFGKDFTIDEEVLTQVTEEDVVGNFPKVYVVQLESASLNKEISDLSAQIAATTDEKVKEELGKQRSEVYKKADDVVVKKSQFYGRDQDYEPNVQGSRDAAWCISYFAAGKTNQMLGGQGYHTKHNDRFYVVLPKSVQYVPEKKYTKVCVQAHQMSGKRDCPKCGTATDIAGYDEKCAKCGANIPAAPVRVTVWDWNDSTMPVAEWHKLFKYWGIPIPKTEKNGY